MPQQQAEENSTSIELVIREENAIVAKAADLINEHNNDISEIIIDTPGIVEGEKKLKITSTNKQKEATDCLGLVKSHLKVIEGRRKLCVKPFQDAVKIINDNAEGISGPLKQVANSVEGKYRAYDAELREAKRKADEAEMKRMEEAAKKDLPPPPPVSQATPAPVKTVKTENTTTSLVPCWKNEILDERKIIDWAIKANRWGLIQVNKTTLNQLAKEVKDSEVIPGLRIYNEPSLPTRSKF